MTRRHMQAFSDSPLHPTRAWPVCITARPLTSPRCPHNNLTISVVPALGLPVPQHRCANYPHCSSLRLPTQPTQLGKDSGLPKPNGLWRTGDGRCSWALSHQFPARGRIHWTLPTTTDLSPLPDTARDSPGPQPGLTQERDQERLPGLGSR